MMLDEVSAPDVWSDAIPLAGWQRSRLDARYGACETASLIVQPGMRLAVTRYRARRDLLELSDRRAHPGALTLSYTLAGCSTYHGEGGRLLFREGEWLASRACQPVGHRRFQAGESVVQVRLAVDDTVWQRYAGAVSEPALAGATVALGRAAMTPRAREHARAVAQQCLLDTPDVLALHGRALDMLTAALHEVGGREPGARPSAVCQAELGRSLIHSLQARIAQRLDLDALCRELGLGRTRLRLLCAQQWGQSPRELLHGLRMRHARECLANGVGVAATAQRVGYAHAANFSTAYRRYHGHPPVRRAH
ncbi:AraC family transcriptional regulator [Verticiella sediminum]